MSRERAIKVINSEPTDKLPQAEWPFGLSRQGWQRLTGIDPYKDVRGAYLSFLSNYDLDLSWGGCPRQEDVIDWEQNEKYDKHDKEGHRLTQWGIFGSDWAEGGARGKKGELLTFKTIEDVLNYNPLTYDKRTVDQMTEEFSRLHEQNVKDVGERALVLEMHYTTLFHWCIDLFGWELFMESAVLEPKRFAGLLERFTQLSIKAMEAWSKIDNLHVLISHDDICMTRGPVFRPDWYRECIFPHYPEIWRPLKGKGIKIFFCSDGDITPFIDDIMEAGADGLIIEPMVDLEYLVKHYGGKKIIIGNVSTNILTHGTEIDVENEINRCLSVAGNCPGYFLNAGGDLTHNMPFSNLETYMNLSQRLRDRNGYRYR